jgi:hypothetical protein
MSVALPLKETALYFSNESDESPTSVQIKRRSAVNSNDVMLSPDLYSFSRQEVAEIWAKQMGARASSDITPSSVETGRRLPSNSTSR